MASHEIVGDKSHMNMSPQGDITACTIPIYHITFELAFLSPVKILFATKQAARCLNPITGHITFVRCVATIYELNSKI